MDLTFFHVIKLNVDASRNCGKTSMVVLSRNHDKEVLGLWCDNSNCSLALATELLAIHKACLALNNFPSKDIHIESDCKITVDALLGSNVCPLRAFTIFQIVQNLLISLQRMDLL